MSNLNRPASSAGEQDRAVRRLHVAKEEQSRAKGTAGDLHNDASLRAADDEVAARERWLKAVDDQHDY